jgi:hypothetical protein
VKLPVLKIACKAERYQFIKEQLIFVIEALRTRQMLNNPSPIFMTFLILYTWMLLLGAEIALSTPINTHFPTILFDFLMNLCTYNLKEAIQNRFSFVFLKFSKCNFFCLRIHLYREHKNLISQRKRESCNIFI